ncbi:hypothetical protein L3X38_040715 [Prunus dulcis]|uniref:Uncharacterized protein n=1 Tax=Prunus dulcis TaxID=3755 RepID=A0AAD4YSQ4_PRUDU|nr:hypothetical protein L3X38_040715 [Prunus dulcis]
MSLRHRCVPSTFIASNDRFSPSPQKLHDQPTSFLHHRHHTPLFLATPVPLEPPYLPLRFPAGPSLDQPAWSPESATEQEFGQQPKQYLEEVAFFATSSPP